ncbi:MAG: RHS repeat-associated core domain-containing protein [Sandaracinaceae bacterium]
MRAPTGLPGFVVRLAFVLLLLSCTESDVARSRAALEEDAGTDAGDGEPYWWCDPSWNLVMGTSASETLTGTSGPDCIVGLGGEDTLVGLGGDDHLWGGSGNDTLHGGDGDDWLEGQTGNDVLYGEDDDDELVGNAGDDELYGGEGTDIHKGRAGCDRFVDSVGADEFYGDEGDDVILTGTDFWYIDAGDGDDVVHVVGTFPSWWGTGGAGNDRCDLDDCEFAEPATCTTSGDCASGEHCDGIGVCVPDTLCGGSCAGSDATCDGNDDDCDTDIDEDYASSGTTCGVGACAATGSTSCMSGSETDSCTPGTPAGSDATCDGIDDDCDASSDEDYASTSTSCGTGVCVSSGTTSCVSGSVEDSCTPGSPTGDDSACNAVDEDCDGSTDEAFASSSTSCGVGVCGSAGATSCVAGSVQDSCTPGSPSGDDSACNGADDDCDASTDEAYASVSTSCGVGACAATGTTSCVGGSVADSCTPGTPSADTSCDGVDQDCDGLVDEAYVPAVSSCGLGVCQRSVTAACVGGVEVVPTCVPGDVIGSDLICDGVDEDCDGSVDEAYVSASTSCGIGVCASTGTATCSGGVVVDSCSSPSSCDEVCDDSTDEDGDGLVDCLDPDCDGDASCPAESCANTTDDDGDGLTDCWDPDCANEASCGSVVPADPLAAAPELGTGIVPFHDRIAFLYEGATAVQTGVTSATFTPRRTSVLFGHVYADDGTPQAGAEITVQGHPELGATHSRADGRYDLVVNGGGQLIVDVRLPGHLPAQRAVQVEWAEWSVVDDVTLVPLDRLHTSVTFGASTSQIVRGSTNVDQVGVRTPTVLIRAGTHATMRMPDGSSSALTNGTIRATEFTVGPDGLERMPAGLPATSGYTHATELSVDEAIEAGASHVEFDQPVVYYLENYWAFDEGVPVPTGYYDRESGRWVPIDSGQIVHVVSEAGGVAALDIDGDGIADDASGIGVDTDELTWLGSLYEPGQSLWRVELDHFTPWDCNTGLGPPPDAEPPKGPVLAKYTQECSGTQVGSVVDCTNRSLGESIPIQGTNLTLNYESSRSPARDRERYSDIPLTNGGSLPESLEIVRVRIVIEGGLVFDASFLREDALSRGTVRWTWDGRDAAGRLLDGPQEAHVSIAYVYPAVPIFSSRFGSMASIYGGGGGAAVRQVALSKRFDLIVGNHRRFPENSVGGWGLDAQHTWSRVGGVLYLGDGTQRNSVGFSGFYGRGLMGTCIDSMLPNALDVPSWESGFSTDRIEVAPDGTIYFIKFGHVWRVDEDGYVRDYVDIYGLLDATGGAQPPYPRDIAVAPNGDLVVLVDHHHTGPDVRLYRFSGPTSYALLAGTGSLAPANGVLASDVNLALGAVHRIAIDRDDNIYLTGDRSRVIDLSWSAPSFGVHVIRPDGRWEVLLPGSASSTCTAPSPAEGSVNDLIPACDVTAISTGPDGSVYFADTLNAVYGAGYATALRRISPDGRIETIAGAYLGTALNDPDAVPALSAPISRIGDIVARPDGTIDFTADIEGYRVVRLQDGYLYRIAGSDVATGPKLDGASNVLSLSGANDLDVLPTGELVYSEHNCLLLLSPLASGAVPYPSEPQSSVTAASDDGSVVYAFDVHGRHLRTQDANTGTTLQTFGYDAAGRVDTITDASGNIVDFTWPLSSGSPLVITSPFGEVTNAYFDADGFLSEVIAPDGATWSLGYGGEQLTSMTDPLGRAHQYAYDPSDGALISDVGPGASGEQSSITLSETGSGNTSTVTTTSALGQTRVYTTEGSIYTRITQTTVDASGLETELIRNADASAQVTLPSGTVSYVTTGPDPRFGMDAPVPLSSRTTLPDGNTTCTVSGRTYDDVSGNVTSFVSAWEGTNSAACDTPPSAPRVSSSVYIASTRTELVTSPEGRSVTTVTDAQGRVIEVQVPGRATAHVAYDSAGRVERTWLTDSLSVDHRETIYAYDATTGRLRTTTTADGRTSRVFHNASGFPTEVVIGWDAVSDAPGPDAESTLFDWDIMGNLTGLTPAGGSEHGLAYSARDELTRHVMPAVSGDALVRASSYDADRRPTAFSAGLFEDVDADGEYTDPVSSGFGVTTTYFGASSPAGSRGRPSTIHFGTDPDDAMATADVTLTYHGNGTPGAGALASLDHSDGVSLDYAYNGPELTSETISFGSTLSATLAIEHEGPGRGLSALELTVGSGTYRATYDADDDGALSVLGFEDGSSTLATFAITRELGTGVLDTTTVGVVDSDLDVSELGDVERRAYAWTHGGLDQGLEFTHSFDAIGRISQTVETRTINGADTVRTFDYTYDEAGRLLTVTWDSVLSESYTYDDNGNRLAWTRDPDGPGALPAVSYTSAQYDARDQLLSYVDPSLGTVSFTYDQAGRLASRTEGSDTTYYRYDAVGNLLQVDRPGGAPTIEYVVDGAGRRTGRSVGGTLDRQWVYKDGLNPVAELDGAGAVQRVFVYGTDAHSPDLMLEVSSGVVYRAVRDHLGTPRVWVSIADGSETVETRFDAYGRAGGAVAVPAVGFAGGIGDELTGLVRFGARDYDPVVGRWVAADPIGFAGGGANLYEYVGSNPVDETDPSGLIFGFLRDTLTAACSRNPALCPAIASAGAAVARTLNSWGNRAASVCPSLGYALQRAAVPFQSVSNVARSINIAQVGQAGELAAQAATGLLRNTDRIESLTETAAYRTPDLLDAGARLIGEVKNVAYLSNTRQLQDFLAYAERYGYEFHLFIRAGEGTRLSAGLRALEELGKVIIHRIL